jgi:calcium permeable stress-gated cation channel
MGAVSGATPIFAFVFLVIWFIVLKNKFRRFYQPKTILVPKWELMKPLPSGVFRWVHTIIKISDQAVIEKCGYDAYFFLRSLQVIFLRVFFWPLFVVFPVHHSGGLPAYKVDWQDVASTKQYWNHLILAIAYTTYLCWVFSGELRLYSERRRAYFCSPQSGIRPSVTTILVTGIPQNWLKKRTLEDLFNSAVEKVEGRVQKTVINRNFDSLNQSARGREDIAWKLEERTTKMIRVNSLYPQDPPYWPTHRRLIFFGKKIDTIHGYWKELIDFKNDIRHGQTWPGQFDQLDSAFITFDTQIAAQMACSSKIGGAPWKMRRKVVSPDDIIWDNLSVGLVARYLRTAGYMAAFCMTLVVFASPLGYIKLLFNDNPVSAKSESRFSAVYQDLGPPFFVFILVSVLPFMIRILAKEGGVHTGWEMELSFHRFGFAAQFIQVFVFRVMFGVTGDPLRSSLTVDAKSIRNLMESIWDPNASTYFTFYTIIQVLSVCGVGLLQLPNFLPWVLFAVINDTPRNRWVRWTTIREVIWGWLFPFYITLACIGMIHSLPSLSSPPPYCASEASPAPNTPPPRGRVRAVLTFFKG